MKKITSFTKLLFLTFSFSLLIACGGGGENLPNTTNDIPLPSAPDTSPSAPDTSPSAPDTSPTDPGTTQPPPVPIVINGDPVLLYSDLTRGPSGSYVTVWGQNIPQDASFTCGNEACEIIDFDYDLNHPAHGRQPSRQKIVVRFYSGSGIKLDGYNTLTFELTNGQIHTINPGAISLSNVNDGDVVYLRGGTYAVSSGGSIVPAKNGIAVVGYPGENAVIDCSNSNALDTYLDNGTLTNFTLANVEMDCEGSGRAIKSIRGSNNLRIIGTYLHDARSSNSGAFGEFSNAVDTYVLGNRIERTGVSGENNAHAIYMGGRGTSYNFQVMWNYISDHVGGRAIQFYGHTSGESLDNYQVSYNHIINAQGNAAILLSRTDGTDKAWLKRGSVIGNTVESSNGSAVDIKSIAIEVLVSDNILFDVGTSIKVQEATSVVIQSNCMDREPNISDPSVVTLIDNRTDYPSCL
jgi:hypothetical protein